MDRDILKTMYEYNQHNKIHFTYVDGYILSLVKQHSPCTVTNKDLVQILLVTDMTIQKSINRLSTLGVINKETKYINGKKVRHMYYDHTKFQEVMYHE